MISAVISTYNREKYLPQVLDSLKTQTISKDDFEIILVNNNSTDRTEEISKEFQEQNPDIKFVYCIESNQGLSYARNRGIQEAKGEYITFIDDNAFLSKDYLEKVVDFFESNSEYASLGSKILLHYEEVMPAWENKYLNSLLGWFDIGEQPLDFDKKNYPRGSNMSFRASVFDKIGDFNVNLGRVGRNLAGSEEKDIHMRLINAGFKSKYIPDAMVYHCVPIERTTTEFIRKQGIGTGKGEWQRVKDEGGMAPLNRLLIELAKWGASILLFFVFLFQGKFAKGWMLLRFRAWVTKGLLSKNKTL